MSIDIGILINNEVKKHRINLVEVGLSNDYKNTIGHYKTAEEALVALEENGVAYEAIFVKGFKSKEFK